MSVELTKSPTCDKADAHDHEFARGATHWDERFSRRDFLALASASLVLAGAGCSGRPAQNIVPYVKQPEQLVPGEPLFYASALTRGGFARGVIVTTREGRPIKIEGNPDHPASLGAADAQMQAAIFSLYDPQRSQNVRRGGTPATWGSFVEQLQRRMTTHLDDQGEGLRILTGVVGSPTTSAQIQQLLKRYPKTQFHEYDPLGAYHVPRDAAPIYRFKNADVIVSLDSDFLWNSGSALADAKQFVDRRRVRSGTTTMNRLYLIESTFSITGAAADHRLPVQPQEVSDIAFYIEGLIRSSLSTDPAEPVFQNAAEDMESHLFSPASRTFVRAAVADLTAARGRCVVLAGDAQPPQVHATVAQINELLGNIGKTVTYGPSPIQPLGSAGPESLAALTRELDDGSVNTLLILADDPAVAAPGDIAFADALKRFSTARAGDALRNFSAHLAPYYNRTSYLCQWHINAAHELESWSDGTAFDGTQSIIQPTIDPLYDGKTPAQLIAAALGDGGASSYQLVREVHQAAKRTGDDFDTVWTEALRRGTFPRTANTAVTSPVASPTTKPLDVAPPRYGPTLRFAPDYSVLDGSLAMNSWLQELPRPLTKLVWSNAAIFSPATANKYQVVDNDLVTIERGQRAIEIPVLILRGHPDEVITLHLGGGQLAAIPEVSGDRGPGAEPTQFIGVDVNPLRSSHNEWFATDAQLFSREKKKRPLVTTRSHNAMANAESAEKRELIRHGSLADFAIDPQRIVEKKKPLLSLYPGWDYSKGNQWGMSIDQTACIGCNACVIACQAENNIPVVGPDQVAAQREMHWLRIDDYFTDAGVQHQPVLCMHCENAPCEYVCPVEATTHSPEGINEMTYNRCVGTRYCSNNCPYKVRRFNFLAHTRPMAASLTLGQNPNVTVRTQGVMEKCTYCVQRINYAKRKVEIATLDLEQQAAAADSEAEKKMLMDRSAELGQKMIEKLQTACQQTCPTNAIVFGDINHRDSTVSGLKSLPHDYTLLDELTTKPRTSYLAKVRNPNSTLSEGKPA